MIRLESYKWTGRKDITEQQFAEEYGEEALATLKKKEGEAIFPTKDGNLVKAISVFKFTATYSSSVSAKNQKEAEQLAASDFAQNGIQKLKVEQTEFEK